MKIPDPLPKGPFSLDGTPYFPVVNGQSQFDARLAATKYICFYHIPKTGGDALQKLILKALSPLGMHSRPFGSWDALEQTYWDFLDVSERQYFFYGHEIYGIHEGRGDGFGYFTFLKDPIQRLLSEFYFNSDTHSSPVMNNPAAKRDALIRFVDEATNLNIQSLRFAKTVSEEPRLRYYSGTVLEVLSEYDPAQTFQEAEQRLRERFFFVGDSGRLVESAFLLFDKLGWPAMPPLPWSNKSKKIDFDDLPGYTRKRLKKLTEADTELYQRAAARIDDAWRRSAFMPSVDDFRAFIDSVAKGDFREPERMTLSHALSDYVREYEAVAAEIANAAKRQREEIQSLQAKALRLEAIASGLRAEELP